MPPATHLINVKSVAKDSNWVLVENAFQKNNWIQYCQKFVFLRRLLVTKQTEQVTKQRMEIILHALFLDAKFAMMRQFAQNVSQALVRIQQENALVANRRIAFHVLLQIFARLVSLRWCHHQTVLAASPAKPVKLWWWDAIAARLQIHAGCVRTGFNYLLLNRNLGFAWNVAFQIVGIVEFRKEIAQLKYARNAFLGLVQVQPGIHVSHVISHATLVHKPVPLTTALHAIHLYISKTPWLMGHALRSQLQVVRKLTHKIIQNAQNVNLDTTCNKDQWDVFGPVHQTVWPAQVKLLATNVLLDTI